MSRKLGLTIVAAALITAYGCGKEEPKKSAKRPRLRPRRRRKWSRSRSAMQAR